MSISTHSPRVGRTQKRVEVLANVVHFNSLAPCGANLISRSILSKMDVFQLTRPVWGEPQRRQTRITASHISTHSPRVGRTTPLFADVLNVANFNSLAPCGANPDKGETTLNRRNFNSLAPCGANPLHPHQVRLLSQFQLTRPVWGEPSIKCTSTRHFMISTHSPRVGRTAVYNDAARQSTHFNSLAPCGANHDCKTHLPSRTTFQLTRPVWGEPLRNIDRNTLSTISTHSPRVGRTTTLGTNDIGTLISTHSPRVGRTFLRRPCQRSLTISTHSPRVGRTHALVALLTFARTFQLTRPVWGEPSGFSVCCLSIAFQLTRPVWGEPLSKTRMYSPA